LAPLVVVGSISVVDIGSMIVVLGAAAVVSIGSETVIPGTPAGTSGSGSGG